MLKSCLVLAASVAVAAIAACGGGPSPTNPTNPTATTSATTPPTATIVPPPEDAGANPVADAAVAPAPQDAAPAQTPFAAQVETGAGLYQKHCAECHDSDGTGISAPAVVGLAKGALPQNPPSDAKDRKTKFNSWFDVGDFVQKAMPPSDKHVKLKDDETWAIMAWILQKNGADTGSGGQALDANLAKTLMIRK